MKPSIIDNIKTRRSKKSDKSKANFEHNGKFSQKHVRLMEELIAKRRTP